MSRPPRRHAGTSPLSVLLVEGPTECIFYGRVKSLYLDGVCPVTVEHIEGLFNVHKKILSALKTRHTDRPVRAYCCLDRESRYAKTPGFDLDFLRQQVLALGMSNVLSVDAIIATQMIESWFFHDLAGIYAFLKVPKSKRKAGAFRPPEAFGVTHLKQFFRRHNNSYCEGERSRHFIENLNLATIVGGCKALSQGIQLILRQSTV